MLKKGLKKISFLTALIFLLTQIFIIPAQPVFAETTVTAQLDASYYRTGSTVNVTIEDATANKNTSALETVTVSVTSTTDATGITVELMETGVSNGIFQGTLLLTVEESNDEADKLQVNDGATITVTYNNGTYTATDTAIVDDTPPVHVSHNPVSDAKGVDPGISTINVVFDEPIQLGSEYSKISIVDSSNTSVTNISAVCDVENKTLELLLSSSLAWSETYTVTVPAGAVEDLAGNPNSEVTWSFKTVFMELDKSTYKSYDTVAVTLYDLAKGSGSVTVMAKCSIYGSDPIYVTLSGSGGVFCGDFNLSSPGGTSDDDQNTLGVTANSDSFTVSYDHDNNGTYDVSASANVDNEAPVVSATSPQDGAGDVAVDEPITITFSEPVLEGDQLNLIEIKDNAGTTVGGISCVIEGNTLTINHDVFEHSTQYTLYLPTWAVEDAVGNMYNTSNSELLHFTTAAIPPAEIHVDDTGSDTAGDGSESNPYSTITKALQAANDGDTIIVHDGTYNESVVVTKDVTITSLNGPEVTTLQPDAGDGFAIQPASGSYGTRCITGFTITGASHGISVSGMSGGLVYLENNIISNCGDGIYIDNHSGGTVYVQKNIISGNTGAGIMLGTSANGDWVEVRWNNIFSNSSGIVHNGSNQLDAPLNFWGNPHGPTHDGINYGDAISSNIDFQPWLVGEFTGEEITTELNIASPTLAEGYTGLEYFAELPEQSNVGGLLQWSFYSSSLPGGINIISGRALYGQPAASGSYGFALEASNGTQAVYKDVSLNVAENYAGNGPAVVSRTPAPYETGVVVDEPIIIMFNEPVQLIDSYQGYITITNEEDYYDNVIVSVILQSNTVSDDTLVITHENLRPDTLYKVSVAENAVTDADGNDFTTTWYFTTGSESIPLEITTSTLPGTAVGENYSTQLEAAGGSGSYTWSIVSGSLPTGLELNSNTGGISGIPTQGGTFNFTVRVEDELSNTAEKPLTVTVEVPDTIPPEVLYTIPDDGETGVSQNVTITVEFNEPIQQGSSFSSISISGNISFSPTIEGDVLKLDPSTNLNANTWYTVEIPGGAVMDTAGNETTGVISFSFQTGETQDTQAPQVSITSPSGDGGLFSNGLTVTGSINEDNLKLVEVSLFSVGQNTYWNDSAGSWVADEAWNSASFSGTAPNYGFQYTTPVLPDGEYQLSVRALDYADNTSEIKTVSFEMDSTQPVVESIVPSDGAYDVAVDQPITVTFSENVVPGDLTLLTLKDANTQEVVPTQASWDEQTGTLIITHSDLEYNTDYELFMDEGIVKDLAGNNNVEKFITFRTAEGDGGGYNTQEISVIFEDEDADGIYYYRSDGESDTLTFSLSGLPTGLSLNARFGSLDENGQFTVTGTVYDGWITGEESGTNSGVYIFSVDIATPDNNNYRPLAIELSGLPAGVEIPPFVLMDSTTNPGELRVAFVNIYAPQPEDITMEMVIDPALDTMENLREIPGVSFTMQYSDGTKIGSIAIGSADNPLDFLALDTNGVPELAKLQQAMEIDADAETAALTVGINTEVLTFLAGKDATITCYNVSEILGLELSENNFRDVLQIQVFDNNNEEVSEISQYINLDAMTYSTTGGEGYDDKLVIPVNHFTTYKIVPAETGIIDNEQIDTVKDNSSSDSQEEADATVDDLIEIVDSLNISEDNITDAIVKAADSLSNITEQVETAEDAEKVADTAAKVAGAITQAADMVKSEDIAAKVVDSAVKVTEVLARATSEIFTDEARQKLAESAINSLNAVEKASQKITSAEKAADVVRTQAAVIRNIKSVVEIAVNAEASAGIVMNTAAVLDSSARFIAKVTSTEEATSAAKEIIDSVAVLAKAATAGATVDANVRQAVWKAQDKVVQIAEKVIEKAGIDRISTDEVVVQGTKAKAVIAAERLAEKAASVVEKAQEMASEIDENDFETNKQLEKKISVEVPAVEGTDEVEVDILDSVHDTVFASGIDKIEIKSEVADFRITANTFSEVAKGKDVSLVARKLDREQLPAAVQAVVSDNSMIVDLNAAVSGKKVGNFAEPIEVTIPYTLKQEDDPEAITVFLIKDDGSVEPVGGKYDSATGKVRFITNYFSSYFAKPAVREFSDLAGYAWAEKQIELLAGKGIIRGKSANSFDPAANITRAEFAVLIARMLKLEGNAIVIPFTDVAPEAWYAKEIAAVYSSGIVSGKSPTKFDPDGKITREEIAAMVTRVLVKQGYTEADEAELAILSDAGKIASWAKTSVATAVREGILEGMGDGVFAPKVNANRAQAAVVLHRLFTK